MGQVIGRSTDRRHAGRVIHRPEIDLDDDRTPSLHRALERDLQCHAGHSRARVEPGSIGRPSDDEREPRMPLGEREPLGDGMDPLDLEPNPRRDVATDHGPAGSEHGHDQLDAGGRDGRIDRYTVRTFAREPHVSGRVDVETGPGLCEGGLELRTDPGNRTGKGPECVGVHVRHDDVDAEPTERGSHHLFFLVPGREGGPQAGEVR